MSKHNYLTLLQIYSVYLSLFYKSTLDIVTSYVSVFLGCELPEVPCNQWTVDALHNHCRQSIQT